MALPRITIEGRLGEDPTLRFTPSGKAVSEMRIVASDKRKNEQGEWEDVATLWITATIWGEYAEHVAESFKKGESILVTGKLKTDSWTTDDNEKRSQIKVDASEVGIPLRFRQIPHGSGQATRSSSREPQADAWSGGGGQQQPSTTAYDEPPF